MWRRPAAKHTVPELPNDHVSASLEAMGYHLMTESSSIRCEPDRTSGEGNRCQVKFSTSKMMYITDGYLVLYIRRAAYMLQASLGSLVQVVAVT